jgi:hypothetical protein
MHKFSKNLDARRVTWSKFYTKDQQTSGATIQKLVAKVTWHPGYVSELLFVCTSNNSVT